MSDQFKSIPMLINGEWVQSNGTDTIDALNPATQEKIAQVNFATEQEINEAVAGAKEAFNTWKEVATPERARLMLRYQHLLKEHHDELAELIAIDTGKNFEDAKGDVWRGIEVVEQAANISALMMGETVENVARGIDSYSYIQPLGVTLGICPFNFPAMIPLWMFPMSLACGNTMVLKPSEQVPLTPVRLLELLQDAGVPNGVVQMVTGGKDQVNQLLEHKDIQTVSFVGSTPVGQHIYKTATDNYKRAQCFTGAKNHTIIMPDADKESVLNNLVGASVGAAGQRCMAISVAVFVGDSKKCIEEFKDKLAPVKPGIWNDPKSAYGPLVSPAAKQRVFDMIQAGIDQGATCLLDGREVVVDGYPDGNWVGPTLFTDVTTEMDIYKQEIFGPVLCCVCVDTLDEAIEMVNANPNGNGTSIFTESGAAARKYQHEVAVGNVGINIPIPVPLPFFSFTGWRGSFMGDLHAYGKQAIRFYTETKTVTSRWQYQPTTDASQPNMSINLK